MKTNDRRSQLRVVKLEQQEKQKDWKVVYKEAEEILLPVKERTKVVDEVKVKSTKLSAKNKTSLTLFTFTQDTLQEIARSVKQFSANTEQQKKQVSSKSEDEVQEQPKKYTIKKGMKKEVQTQPQKQEIKKGGEKARKQETQESEASQEEESEPQKKRSTRWPQAQKQQKALKKEEKLEEEEEDEEEVGEVPSVKKSNGRKSEEILYQQIEKQTKKVKPTPTQKQVSKRERSQISQAPQDEDDEEPQESQSQSQSMSQSVDNRRKKKFTTKKSKSQPAESNKFIKGKANPLYREQRQTSEQFEGTSQKFHDYSSMVMNNKELIRAAKIGSQRLMNDIFVNSSKISNIFQKWAPENEVSALEIILQRQDKAMLLQYIKSIGKLKLGVTPRCSLKVAEGRDGREENNALVSDQNQVTNLDQMIDRLLTMETDPKFFGLMIAQLGNEHTFYENIALAVRCGNWKTAGYLVQTVLAF